MATLQLDITFDLTLDSLIPLVTLQAFLMSTPLLHPFDFHQTGIFLALLATNASAAATAVSAGFCFATVVRTGEGGDGVAGQGVRVLAGQQEGLSDLAGRAGLVAGGGTRVEALGKTTRTGFQAGGGVMGGLVTEFFAIKFSYWYLVY
jgi:hypothetical protein